MCPFGAAAWKTTNGSWEEHKYTETSSEGQSRWGGALTHSYVPHPTPVVNSSNIWALISQSYTIAWPYTQGFGPAQSSGLILRVKSWPHLIQEGSDTDLSGTRTFALCCFHGMMVYRRNLTPFCVSAVTMLCSLYTSAWEIHLKVKSRIKGRIPI